MSDRRSIDVKRILNEEIQTYSGQDDVNHRLYHKNGSIERLEPELQKPTVPYVPGPTDPSGAYAYGGLPYADAIRYAQQNARNMQYHPNPRAAYEAQYQYAREVQRQSEFAEQSKLREARSTKRSEIGIEDHYFLFDSFFKESSSDAENGLYVFDVTQLNDNFPIKNIIEMEIHAFTIPQIEVEAWQPNYFKTRELFLDVENIRAQQFVHGPFNTKLRNYHFKTRMTTDLVDLSGRFLCDPSRHSSYIFTMPIRSLNEVKIRFKTTHRNVEFRNDTFDATTVTSAGPSPANRQIRTFSPHRLTIGSTVDIMIDGFQSTNVELNHIMNNLAGLKVDVIDDFVLQLTLAPAIVELLGSVKDANGNNPQFEVRIIDRRISIQMRFRSLVTKVTNFISP